jgi:putative phage-type endonuclease
MGELIPVIQGSPEWLAERHGRITGSHMADVLAFLKTGGKGETKARYNYKIALIAERLTGRATECYVSPEMQWGTDNEPLARGAYEVETGRSVEQVGFYVHPIFDYAGGSPDGLVGKDGLIEIKCAKTATHIAWMLDGIVPPEHEPQMSWYMACTDRKWCDFVSFDPRLPEHLQLFIVRLMRSDERIAEMEAAAQLFEAEIESLMARLPKRIQPKTQAEGLLTDEDFAGLL